MRNKTLKIIYHKEAQEEFGIYSNEYHIVDWDYATKERMNNIVAIGIKENYTFLYFKIAILQEEIKHKYCE